MNRKSALSILAMLGTAALSAASTAQTTPDAATAAVTPPADSGERGNAQPPAPPPTVAAPSRSAMAQAGDTRGAATASSGPAAPTQAASGRSREQVRAEAVSAVTHHRATLSADLDLLDGR